MHETFAFQLPSNSEYCMFSVFVKFSLFDNVPAAKNGPLPDRDGDVGRVVGQNHRGGHGRSHFWQQDVILIKN